eukprot:1180507-Prorocentrum_minimum.AAC.2
MYGPYSFSSGHHLLGGRRRGGRHRDHRQRRLRGRQEGVRRGSGGGQERIYRSSLDTRKPQNPTKSEEYRIPEASSRGVVQ